MGGAEGAAISVTLSRCDWLCLVGWVGVVVWVDGGGGGTLCYYTVCGSSLGSSVSHP